MYNVEEMIKFLDMIGRGEDPLYETRLAAVRKNVKHFDSKNGWRIKEFIKQAFKEATK